jgi:hypothetical protein
MEFNFLICFFIFNSNAAGSNFQQYGVAHAGLGVWDTTTDDKFTIEFISNNYVGALLPNLANGVLTWENSGSIVITDPIDDTSSYWINSRLITTTTGSAYNQLITYLQGSRANFATYTPITALSANKTLIDNYNGADISNDDLSSIGGSILLQPINSFAFVDTLIDQLSSYGCDLGSFLNIYTTSFNYMVDKEANTPLKTVPSNLQDVYQW